VGAGGATATIAVGKRRHRRKPVMAEINVTPMVDVMLVLLIIFMVSAPLLTVGVPIDLPQTQAKSLDQDKEPLTVTVNTKGEVYLQNSEIKIDELVPKLQAITQARGGNDERIYVRGDRKVDYGTVMRVMGRLSAAGYRRSSWSSSCCRYWTRRSARSRRPGTWCPSRSTTRRPGPYGCARWSPGSPPRPGHPPSGRHRVAPPLPVPGRVAAWRRRPPAWHA